MKSNIINTYHAPNRSWTLHHGEVRSVLPTLPPNSFHGVLSVLSPMQHSAEQFDCELWEHVFRLCRPGASLLALGGQPSFHRAVCAVEDAGWRIIAVENGSVLLATKDGRCSTSSTDLKRCQHALAASDGRISTKSQSTVSFYRSLAGSIPRLKEHAGQRLLIPSVGSSSAILGGLSSGWRHVTGIEHEAEQVGLSRKHLSNSPDYAGDSWRTPAIDSELVRMNSFTVGDCRDLIPRLPDRSIHAVVTSPPYADQRKNHYPGVPASQYPDFTVDWMSRLIPKLTDDASVLIVIRPDLKKGVINDCVLRTRLALRDAGWEECEELIWLKRDGGACMGSYQRPRRCYEHILWFSRTHNPFVDVKACGHWSDNVSIRAACPAGKQFKEIRGAGHTKLPDVIDVPVRRIPRGVEHPAMFPPELAEILIKTFCPRDGVVLDPFSGSGNTCLAAQSCGRSYHGFEIMSEYCELSQRRLDDDSQSALAG